MRGRLHAPPSKSYLIRAAALALLAPGRSLIHNVGHSKDEQIAIGLLRTLGAKIALHKRSLEVYCKELRPLSYTLHCGESALAMRIFTCIAALLPMPMQLRATGSLAMRPQHPFSEFFPALGVAYANTEGHAPLFVQGALRPTNLSIDGALSSQFATGLLIAYVATGAQNTTLRLRAAKSKPYLALTLALLARFGCSIAHNNYEQFRFERAQPLRPTTIHVPGDWSSAAYLLVAAVLSGTLALSGLANDSFQADRAIVSILQEAQCHILYRHTLEGNISALEVLSTPFYAAFQCNLEHSPDLFPALAALAAFAKGTSYISGLHRLTHKESNRSKNIIDLLTQVGILCEKKGDTLCIHGKERIPGGISVSGKNDHRIVMMAALLALRSEAGLYIEGPEAVSKSFPHFFTYLKKVGISVEEIPSS